MADRVPKPDLNIYCTREAPIPPGRFLQRNRAGSFLDNRNQKEVSGAALYLMETLIRHFDFCPAWHFLGLTQRAE